MKAATRFISYAQNFEDVMLWRALGHIKRGFYIDIGAADPVDMSVTHAFCNAGWRGVNVEPALHYFSQLQAARTADVNLQIAVGGAPGTAVFHEIIETGLSTLDAGIATGHAAQGWAVQTREVELITLTEICRLYAPPDIHFLKIDVEGAEGQVLAGTDFASYRPWIILLEATRPLTTKVSFEWEPMLLEAGYVFVWFDGLNRFYIATERHAELQEHFQLPPNSFDNFDKYDPGRDARTAWLQLSADAAAQRLRDQANEIDSLEQEVLLRRRMQAEPSPVQSPASDALLSKPDLAQLSANSSVLISLAYDLRWHDGPRTLQLVLPLARAARALSKIPWLRTALRPAVRAARFVHRAGLKRNLHNRDATDLIALPPDRDQTDRRSAAGIRAPLIKLRHAVHQFHPGSAYGDAVTNSMLLTQRILQTLGYRSEIYVEHRDPLLAGQLLLLDDLPLHDEYVLILLHSLGHDQAERIAALAAPKLIMYHNITPAYLLTNTPGLARLADLGRAQLDFWRPRTVAALAVSEFNAMELRRHGFQDITVCPLLFDIDKLREGARPGQTRKPDDPFTILFVGRIIESKGQAELVDAFSAFNLLYGKPCRLVLIGQTKGGSDQYLADLYQRIAEQGLRRSVLITGHIADDALFDWYDRADLYVSLSLHEGFGVPLIEAMAHDVAVIAYGAAGVPFTMHQSGDAATILDTRNAAKVAETMLDIANDPERRIDIVQTQRQNLDRFQLSRHIPGLAQALARAGAIPPLRGDQAINRRCNFTVAGHFNGTYSLASVNRSLASALAAFASGRVSIQPVEGEATLHLAGVPDDELPLMTQLAAVRLPSSASTVVISQHYPVYVPSRTAPADCLIAYFFWEESLIPWAMVAQLNNNFDGIFAPSQFVTKSLIDSGVRLPVHTIGYAPKLEKFARLHRNRSAGRQQDFCTFLHVSSAFPRKGIDVLLAAYTESFSAEDPVRLVIKTFPNPHNEVAAQVEHLRAAQPSLPKIELIDRDLTETELVDLYANADIAVLPTRGEGFNIPAAEALAAGLRLIVTGAGGHTDFVDAEQATLIPWQMRHSQSHLASSQSLWLEPDAVLLSRAMRSTFNNVMAVVGAGPQQAFQARDAVMRRLDPANWARRINQAAGSILNAPASKPRRILLITSWNVRCGVAEYSRHLVNALLPIIEHGDELAILSDDRTLPAETPLRIRVGWSLGATKTAEQIATAVSQQDPNIILIQYQPGLIDWASLATLLTDRRLQTAVITITLHTTLQLLELSSEQATTVLTGLRGCARVIVHTVADVNLLHRCGLSTNVVMIPQGAAPPQNWMPPKPIMKTSPTIGCYGFLLPPKGLDLLIDAIPAIRAVWPKLRVRMVNALYPAEISDQELSKCQSLARDIGVQDCIEWITDFLPHEDSMLQLRGCDLIVLPYRQTTESSSAALRSCLSSGTPVAVTPLPIFDEAEDAVRRFGGDTPAAIAGGVIDLLKNLEARQKLQEAGGKWLEQRSWDQIACRTYGMVTGLAVNRDDLFLTDHATVDEGAPRKLARREQTVCA